MWMWYVCMYVYMFVCEQVHMHAYIWGYGGGGQLLVLGVSFDVYLLRQDLSTNPECTDLASLAIWFAPEISCSIFLELELQVCCHTSCLHSCTTSISSTVPSPQILTIPHIQGTPPAFAPNSPISKPRPPNLYPPQSHDIWFGPVAHLV